jgi:hypothetical protein
MEVVHALVVSLVLHSAPGISLTCLVPLRSSIVASKAESACRVYLQTCFSGFCGFPVHASFISFFDGRTMRFTPIQGVLIGESPVKISRSYRNPPKTVPMNGQIMGTQK